MMSVLLRANASENPTNKMTEQEVIFQITCVIAVPSPLNMIQVVACLRLPRIQYTAPCRA